MFDPFPTTAHNVSGVFSSQNINTVYAELDKHHVEPGAHMSLLGRPPYKIFMQNMK